MLKTSQKTLNEPVELKGVGLHNGLGVNLLLKPSDVNTGIKFKRVDLDENNIIDANYNNVTSPVLCTKIENKSGVSVSTVEHLMAALYICGIDNLIINLDGPEVPIIEI